MAQPGTEPAHQIAEAGALVAGLGLVHFTMQNLMEGAGILIGMIFVYALRETVTFRKRAYYAIGSGAAGLILNYGVTAWIFHKWPDQPIETRAVYAFLLVLCSMPIVNLWRGMWRAASGKPDTFVDMVIGLIRRIFNLPRSGGGSGGSGGHGNG